MAKPNRVPLPKKLPTKKSSLPYKRPASLTSQKYDQDGFKPFRIISYWIGFIGGFFTSICSLSLLAHSAILVVIVGGAFPNGLTLFILASISAISLYSYSMSSEELKFLRAQKREAKSA